MVVLGVRRGWGGGSNLLILTDITLEYNELTLSSKVGSHYNYIYSIISSPFSSSQSSIHYLSTDILVPDLQTTLHVAHQSL